MKHLLVVVTCVIYILCLSSQGIDAFTQLGCYQDGVPTIFQTERKILQYPTNSPDLCQTFCVLGEYPIFGLKNGKECWCSMSLDLVQSYGGLVESCNTPCTGDATKMCGGTDAMEIYHTRSVTVSTCPNGASSGNCVTACSAGFECIYPLGNIQNELGICCPVDESAGGFTHMGCYGDGIHHIVSTNRKNLNQQQNTPDSCHDYCLMEKYPFFALKKGNQCWCIMNLALITYPLTAGSCNSRCSGDSSLVCGGRYALDIYESQSTQVSRCQYGGPSGQCAAAGTQCSPGFQCNTNVQGEVGMCCPTPPFWYQGCFAAADILNSPMAMNGYFTYHTCYDLCKLQGYLYFGLISFSCYCGSDTTLLGTSTGAVEAVCNSQTTAYSVYEITTAGCPSRDSLPAAFSQGSCKVGRQCVSVGGVKQTCCPTQAGGSVCWPPVGMIQMPSQCDAKYPVMQNSMFGSVDPLEMSMCDSTGNCIVDASTQLTLRGQSEIFTSTEATVGLKWAFTATESTYVTEFEVLRMCTSVRGVDRVIIQYSTLTGGMNQMQVLIFDPTLSTEVCSSRPFGVVDWVKFVYHAAKQNTVNNSGMEISSTSLEYCVKTLTAVVN